MLADIHYDLLTHVYIWRHDIERMISFARTNYNTDNITHGILNLFFMPLEEMGHDLNIKKEEIDVLKMLKITDELIKKYNLLPNPESFIYQIEGCTYLKIENLEELKALGVRAIAPVWNDSNMYGSGNRNKDKGLTKKGILLIKKAVDLGYIIDLAHANEKTFWDIIFFLRNIKKSRKEVMVMVSHANAKALYDKNKLSSKQVANLDKTLFMNRNLTDDQILAIKEFDGLIGVMLHKKMLKPVFDNKEIININEPFNLLFLHHIEYIGKLIGYKNIAIATDNMNYDPDPICPHLNNCEYKDTKKLLKKIFHNSNLNQEQIEDIMYQNFIDKVLNKLKRINHYKGEENNNSKRIKIL